MNQNYKNVHIGEVKTGQGEETLQAILGSCVGIAILYPGKNLYGLAHALLPKMKVKTEKIGGRFVDQAISSLLKLMDIKEFEFKEVKAVLAGGANMTKPIDEAPEKLVGVSNSNSAESLLKELGIKIIYKDLGGQNGKKIQINCNTGSFNISRIPRN